MTPPVLFVYGTLKPTLAPAVVRGVVDRFRPLGPATVRGALYDFGRYPGVVINAAGDLVHGELFALAGNAAAVDAAFLRLDRYEGVNHARLKAGLFRRVVVDAERPDGDLVEAWVYVYNGPVPADRRVPTGRWPAVIRPECS